jgi:serine/threonine protein kinase
MPEAAQRQAVGVATAAAAAAAAEPMGDTLPAGMLVRVALQHLQLVGDKVQQTTAIGEALVEVLQQLGSGGNAHVYLCTLKQHELSSSLPAGSYPPYWPNGRPGKVVLKVPIKPPNLSAQQDSLFQQLTQVLMWKEHDMLCKLRASEYVIDSYGFCSAQAVGGELLCGCERMPCLMLEWAQLGSLWQTVAPADGPPAPMIASKCRLAMSHIVSAVHDVHEAGFFHRDIKPENVLVFGQPGSRRRTYKLCDFGIAVPYPDRFNPLRNEGKDGTPGYLPPERNWCAQSDTWQIGKCMLALRSGAAPHEGSCAEVQASGMYDNLPDPIRESEWVFLKECLHPDSGSRPAPLELQRPDDYPFVL